MNRLHRQKIPWRAPVMVATQLAALYGEEGLIWLDGDGSTPVSYTHLTLPTILLV